MEWFTRENGRVRVDFGAPDGLVDEECGNKAPQLGFEGLDVDPVLSGAVGGGRRNTEEGGLCRGVCHRHDSKREVRGMQLIRRDYAIWPVIGHLACGECSSAGRPELGEYPIYFDDAPQ